MGSTASKFGMTSEPLRISVRRAEVDGGKRPGVTSEESEFASSNGENRALRRTNEVPG